MSNISKFLRDLLIGLALIIIGIYLSLVSKQFLFYGIMIVGLFAVIVAFKHLSQSKNKKDELGYPIKDIYPTDKPQEKAIFLQTLESQEDLVMPKQVSIACSRRDQAGPVFLNGVKVGAVAPNTPLVFIVTKRNNVVNISEQYEGICFFHVVDPGGIGVLKIGIGMQSASLKVVRNSGLVEGIALNPDKI